MTIQLPIRASGRVVTGLAATIDEFIDLRRDFHAHPELAFEEHRTGEKVASLLASWGYEVATGIAGTGVVATLRRGERGKSLGIRADIDALPITEQTGLDYASANPGVMHACGHDGHTAILLAAARFLAEHGEFSGTLHLIFQPAEEIGAGAARMISEGLFERFACDAVFGLHNWPGEPAGKFGFVTGPAMASVDRADIVVTGKGGHGAAPHETIDPVVAAAHVITALQSVVARNVDPLDMAVVTVGSIHGGSASNVIPDSVELKLTTRTYRPELRAGAGADPDRLGRLAARPAIRQVRRRHPQRHGDRRAQGSLRLLHLSSRPDRLLRGQPQRDHRYQRAAARGGPEGERQLRHQPGADPAALGRCECGGGARAHRGAVSRRRGRARPGAAIGPDRRLPDIVGTSDEIVEQLSKDPILPLVSEFRMGLPYDFPEEDYRQVMHDFVHAVAPALGWRGVGAANGPITTERAVG